MDPRYLNNGKEWQWIAFVCFRSFLPAEMTLHETMHASKLTCNVAVRDGGCLSRVNQPER